MIGTGEHHHLMKKFQSDSKYGAITDRYERMHYLVRRRAAHLAHFGEHILELCAQHERAHRKSSGTAHYYLSQAKMISKKHKVECPLAEVDYNELMTNWDTALRNMSIDWNDWTVMQPILELFVMRAKIDFELGNYKKATSDLMHASSVLEYFNHREVMLAHFEAQDSQLLIILLVLKAELLDQLNSTPDKSLQRVLESYHLVENDVIREKLNTRHEIVAILGEIQSLDAIFESQRKQANSSQFSEVNYNISEKVHLNSTEQEGRVFVASESIGMNEDILKERAQSVVIFSEHLFTHCNYCHQATITYWPCAHCIEIGFCSAKCAMLAFAEYHRFECGIFGFIMGQNNYYSMGHTYRLYSSFGIEMTVKCEDKELDVINGKQKPFDLADYLASSSLRTEPFHKLNETSKNLMLGGITSLLSHRGEHEADREDSNTVNAIVLAYCFIHKGVLKSDIVQDQKMYSRLLEHIATTMLRICTNGFCWAEQVELPDEANPSKTMVKIEKIASCISLVASFVNHSCNANVNWSIVDGIIHFTALRDIQSNEQLSICYGPKRYNDFSSRQNRLRYDYCFYCRCEACMTDAANETSTLKCHSPGSHCSGPLVLNEFGACLECGYQPASNEIKQAKQTAKRSEDKFAGTIDKLHRSKKSLFGSLKCFLGAKVRHEKPSTQAGDKVSLQTFVKIDRKRITQKRVERLEKHLDIYAETIYSASYHLLEKCSLLLKVYHEAGQDSRGLRLIGHLNRCLKHIYPSMTDNDLTKLVYILDYAASFFEKFNLTSGADESDETQAVCDLAQRLNEKLVDILKYDQLQRGHFFPVLRKQLKAQSKDGDDLNNFKAKICTAMFGKEELFFYKLQQDCQRRLSELNNKVAIEQQ